MVDKTGKTVYARTFNWSSTGVATGSARQTVQFTLPVGTEADRFRDVHGGRQRHSIGAIPEFDGAGQDYRNEVQRRARAAGDRSAPDGVREADEGGVSHVMIYVDLNNDGKPGITEPRRSRTISVTIRSPEFRPGRTTPFAK